MNKIRFKQAQSLLLKTGKSQGTALKFKTAQEGTINSDLYADIINKIIETEEFIYSSRPTHHLLQEDAEQFCNSLIDIRNKIDDMLVEFEVLERENVEEKVEKLSQEFIILTTKGNFKKILTRWGVEPQRIVVAGVPLDVDDMRILNPKIPESALEPIKKKINHVKNDVNRKIRDLDTENILVVVEKDKSGEVLGKRAEDLYGARVIKKDSLKDTDILEFKRALEN
ncbi:DUF2100 domain-containing protein [Methanobacterium ferruginis]|uniref:DUF2100 domain-containing protein n=1 Tax=Methanobacterium ferruginis TaxID=710191 RepID=UPI0025734813|nr:DUF2100 domain-containing protein [Methanobacterium ferruginis]BDZ66879.1 hypothetical protein GCM10025860_03270 [Methanobacterium ferruginis]